MSTTSTITVLHKNGKVSSIYCHWDGDSVGSILKRHYGSLQKAEALVSLGNLSTLGPRLEPKAGESHTFEKPAEDVTVAYHRDRKEKLRIDRYDSLEDFLGSISTDPMDYNYLFDGSWKVAKFKQIRDTDEPNVDVFKAVNESSHYNNQLEAAPWDQIGYGYSASIYFKPGQLTDLQKEKTVEYVHKHGGRPAHLNSRWSGPIDIGKEGMEAWFAEEKDVKDFISDMKKMSSFKKCDYERVWYDPAGGKHYGEDDDPIATYESESIEEAKAYDKQSWEHVKVGERYRIGPVSMVLNPDNAKNSRVSWPAGADVEVEKIENDKITVRMIRPDGSLATAPRNGDSGGFKWMKFDIKSGPKIVKELESKVSSTSNTGIPTFENMTNEHLLEAIQLKPVNIRLADGSIKTISSPTEVTEDLVFESIEEVYSDGFEELSERVVLKRKYGQSPEVSINSHGPLRNNILEFIGNRFVTEGELNSFFNQLEEARGKKLNYRKWFNENQKFFESYTLKGTKVWSLSKVGKRAFEHIVELRSGPNAVNERTILDIESFMLNEELQPKLIIEGEIPETEAAKIKEVISSNGFMSLREPLKALGWKVDFSFSPVATYIITKGKLKVAILNKKYVDDVSDDQIIGDIAFGLMESVATPASAKTVQKVIELTLKNVKPEVTEDEVVKQLAAIKDLEDLYDVAVKLVQKDKVKKFEEAFPIDESKELDDSGIERNLVQKATSLGFKPAGRQYGLNLPEGSMTHDIDVLMCVLQPASPHYFDKTTLSVQFGGMDVQADWIGPDAAARGLSNLSSFSRAIQALPASLGYDDWDALENAYSGDDYKEVFDGIKNTVSRFGGRVD